VALKSLALAVVLSGVALAADDARPVSIDVRGNVVLPAAVYVTLLGPQSGVATMALVDALVDRVSRFLHASGYTLATVDGHIEGETVVLSVNEGLLDRVVFRGRLTFQMIRLKLALDLPHEVFNRPHLQQQLATLSAQLGVEPPAFELVPSAVIAHVGPQLDTLGPLGTIKGATLVHPRQQYELHLLFPQNDWSTGFGLDLRSSYFDGLEVGVNYQGHDVFFLDDRWRVALSGGAAIRRDLPTAAFYVYPSRAFAEAQYFSPAVVKVVRGFLWLRSEVLARQRADLQLENSVTAATELSANLQVALLEGASLTVGFGGQHFLLFGERAPEGAMALAERYELRWRGFVRLGLDVVLDVPGDRWDRRHALLLEGRLFNNVLQFEKVSFGQVRLQYQKVFAFGWHDLWLKSQGAWLVGDVLYPFEEPLGEHLRAVFGDVFTRAVFSGRAEFRFSLTRDLFKLGAFVDAAAYAERAPLTNALTPRLGLAMGPSFHALIEGMFQMDLAVSFGLLSTGRFNTGLYAVLIKVF
jgi:hypothetical protein